MKVWNLPKGCRNRLRDYLGRDIPNKAFNLIKKMLSYSPEKRISARDALQHPFFRSFGNNYDCQKMAQWLNGL
ncbi:unnamed protein product [Hymenolepis diminuta]|uniref:Protein kinase domain-containing protein n=1 Tax=Hymenolepis diminuta TaxID=6216 RepID=A0A564XWV7_HYMDI|nr:unnamed protein product [Hymenolepis diminuta]